VDALKATTAYMPMAERSRAMSTKAVLNSVLKRRRASTEEIVSAIGWTDSTAKHGSMPATKYVNTISFCLRLKAHASHEDFFKASGCDSV
jgi:hypothetical protein